MGELDTGACSCVDISLEAAQLGLRLTLASARRTRQGHRTQRVDGDGLTLTSARGTRPLNSHPRLRRNILTLAYARGVRPSVRPERVSPAFAW